MEGIYLMILRLNLLELNYQTIEEENIQKLKNFCNGFGLTKN